jgi:hypothetical protein
MDRYVERQQGNVVRRHTEAAEATTSPETHPLLRLQRQVGNAQIARLLAQRAGEEEEMQAKHDLSQRAGEEEEMQASHDLSQRQGAEEDEAIHASHDLSQRVPEVGLAGGPVSDQFSQRLSSQRGAGSPLEDGTRSSMEDAFGTSFADVRVHSGHEAAALNRSITAKAFTTGNDIFLGEGASAADSQLMAHELTHVVQQRDMTGGGGDMRVSPAGDSHEQAADATASVVTSGGSLATTAQRKLHQHD